MKICDHLAQRFVFDLLLVSRQRFVVFIKSHFFVFEFNILNKDKK